MGVFLNRTATQRQTDRRAEILDAAQSCFARMGFHQASMQQICAAAGMSPGNLYRYFPSKEAIIAGIAERDRAEVAENLSKLTPSADFFGVLTNLAQHYFAERTDEQVGMCLEITMESRRNPEIARIHHAFNADVKARLIAMLRQAAERGEISRDIDFEHVTAMLMVIVDGVWSQRVSDPAFDPKSLLPLFMDVVRHMLLDPPKRQSEEKSQ
jgi:TetR/AcrR family transcriptional regulator, repressor for uid operon